MALAQYLEHGVTALRDFPVPLSRSRLSAVPGCGADDCADCQPDPRPPPIFGEDPQEQPCQRSGSYRRDQRQMPEAISIPLPGHHPRLSGQPLPRFLGYDVEIRRMTSTTNAIEPINALYQQPVTAQALPERGRGAGMPLRRHPVP